MSEIVRTPSERKKAFEEKQATEQTNRLRRDRVDRENVKSEAKNAIEALWVENILPMVNTAGDQGEAYADYCLTDRRKNCGREYLDKLLFFIISRCKNIGVVCSGIISVKKIQGSLVFGHYVLELTFTWE